jgi:hypothetical protein
VSDKISKTFVGGKLRKEIFLNGRLGGARVASKEGQGFGNLGAGVFEGDVAAFDLLEEFALKGSAAFGAVLVDAAAFVFESGTRLEEEVFAVVDAEAHDFESGGFARGKFDIGKQRPVAAEAATRAECLGQRRPRRSN